MLGETSILNEVHIEKWVYGGDGLSRLDGRVVLTPFVLPGETARISIGEQEVTLLKPTVYMNRSGMSIRQLSEFFKIAPAEILVAHDELDLPVGSVRLKHGGGHGGHNGLRDTIAHIGDGFWRLRLGIGHPGKKAEVIDYVLTRAPPAEEELILEAVNTAADCVPLLLEEGAERAMAKLHSRAGKS